MKCAEQVMVERFSNLATHPFQVMCILFGLLLARMTSTNAELELRARMTHRYSARCYPKQSARIPTNSTRDAGWDVLHQAGLRPVTQIAVDAVWSALGFRPEPTTG